MTSTVRARTMVWGRDAVSLGLPSEIPAHMLFGRSQPRLRSDLQLLPLLGLAFFTRAVVTVMVFKVLIVTPITRPKTGRLSTHC